MRGYTNLFIAAVSLLSSIAFGWGATGHLVTSRIAEYYLTPTTQAKLKKVLIRDLTDEALPRGEEGEPQQKAMPPLIAQDSISVWADRLRPQKGKQNRRGALWPLTRTWHYLNLPIEAEKMEVDVHCPNDDCIVRRLQSLIEVLKERQLPYLISQKTATSKPYELSEREVVKFIVHFFGDLSQPLHICENDKDQNGHAVEGQDRGGNSRKVSFFGEATVKYASGEQPLNLHSLWDDKMIAKRMQADKSTHREARRPYAYSEVLFKRISAKQKQAWKSGDIESWGWESHEKAVGAVYQGINLDFKATTVITKEYYQRAIRVIEEQLQKGGYTLALILNEIYDPDFDRKD